jgi:hypothetical protein
LACFGLRPEPVVFEDMDDPADVSTQPMNSFHRTTRRVLIKPRFQAMCASLGLPRHGNLMFFRDSFGDLLSSMTGPELLSGRALPSLRSCMNYWTWPDTALCTQIIAHLLRRNARASLFARTLPAPSQKADELPQSHATSADFAALNSEPPNPPLRSLSFRPATGRSRNTTTSMYTTTSLGDDVSTWSDTVEPTEPLSTTFAARSIAYTSPLTADNFPVSDTVQWWSSDPPPECGPAWSMPTHMSFEDFVLCSWDVGTLTVNMLAHLCFDSCQPTLSPPGDLLPWSALLTLLDMLLMQQAPALRVTVRAAATGSEHGEPEGEGITRLAWLTLVEEYPAIMAIMLTLQTGYGYRLSMSWHGVVCTKCLFDRQFLFSAAIPDRLSRAMSCCFVWYVAVARADSVQDCLLHAEDWATLSRQRGEMSVDEVIRRSVMNHTNYGVNTVRFHESP